MKPKKLIIRAMAVCAAAVLAAGCSPRSEMDRFVDRLMSKMTVEEKIGQLNLVSDPGFRSDLSGNTSAEDLELLRNGGFGAFYGMKDVGKMTALQKIAVEETRLGIPLMFGIDAIHGLETTFPIPLALACSWNMDLIEESAARSAKETSSLGVSWVFSPMVDISRDPRWGRVAEGAGEDPYLGGEIAKAMVRGYQGDGSFESNDKVMACVKHYALYGAAEAGRDYNTVSMDRQTMFNVYLRPYQEACKAGAGSYMSSFNEVEGVPATCNEYLLDDVLRGLWGFDGFVVTDATAINEITAHGLGDLQEVSARALQAGIDLDMNSNGFIGTLKKSLEEGRVSEKDIDKACRRILEAKYRMGLFDDPYRYLDPARAEANVYTDESRAFARRAAHESAVLLKNEGGVLPLSKDMRIALVGPLGNDPSNMQGTWSMSSHQNESVTILEGLRNAVKGRGSVRYAQGSWLLSDANLEANLRGGMMGFFMPGYKPEPVHNRPLQSMINEAVALARQSDVVVAALGEINNMNGEGTSRSDISIPEPQRQLLKALKATGKPIVLVLTTGRPLTLEWENENIPAILNTWALGAEAGNAIADLLFGDVNPSGKLTMSFPRNVGQIPVYYNHKNTGRPHGDFEPYRRFTSCYLDVINAPLYPFGYGLSYTSYEYGELQLSSATIGKGEKVTASISVTNTGGMDGDETVQLHLRDVVSSSTRPVKELIDFKKVHIPAGESVTVSFEIGEDKLKYYNHELEYVCESGDFLIMAGPDSNTLKEATLTLI